MRKSLQRSPNRKHKHFWTRSGDAKVCQRCGTLRGINGRLLVKRQLRGWRRIRR